MALTVGVLREAFRSLQQFRALYENEGIDLVCDPESGECLSLWDLEYLYEQIPKLPRRQAQAIELCLVQNLREVEVAVIMGVSPTNPVMSYATAGLAKLLYWIDQGKLPRFGPDFIRGEAVS